MISMMPLDRKISFLVSIFFFILSLSSCTQLTTFPQEDLNAQVDGWIAADEYGKAIEAIHYVQPEHPQYQELKNRQESVLELAQNYEKSISERVNKLIGENLWDSALNLIDQAKKNYPGGQLIYEADNKLHKLQAEQITKLEQRLVISRAKWMEEALPVYKNLININPKNTSLNLYVDQLEYEAESLAKQLTWMAEQAIDDKHFKTAQLRLALANNIAPEPQRTELLNKIIMKNEKNKKIVQSNKINQEIKQQQKNDSQYQQALFDNIERSYNSGWLAVTKNLISQLDETEQQSPEIIQLSHEVDKAIEQQVTSLFSQADKLYEEGQFEMAIGKWQSVLIYEPDNESALENIQRAEKVIEKIEHLREKQLQQ